MFGIYIFGICYLLFGIFDISCFVKKLQIYGIRGKELLWFKSYLSHRKQCCKVSGKLSDLGEVTCRVPQGSFLCPLLVIIYINDPPLSIKHSQVNMYADDTSLLFSS